MVGMIEESVESIVYILLTLIAIVFTYTHVSKDWKSLRVASFEAKNDEYVLLAVKIWSGVFIVLVALLLLLSRSTIPMQQLNLFLIISLSGILIDQMPLFAYVFAFASALSWYDLYYAFIHSPPGVTVSRLLEPKWIIAFYCMTSSVICGHLKEKNKVLHLKSSVFQLACIILVWSCSVPLQLVTSQIGFTEIKFLEDWNKMPIRLEEMELGSHYRIVCILCMIVLHFGTRVLISSADSDVQVIVSSKKTDEVSPEDTTNKAASPYHKYVNSGNDVEGSVSAEDTTVEGKDIDLPSDCVEVSEEEAVRLVEGKSSSRSNAEGVTQRKRT